MMQPQQPQQGGGFGQAIQGLFGQQMLPFWAGLAFGGTRSDQGRLASTALMQGNQLTQDQQQFTQRQALAREQMSALERYRNAQLGIQQQGLALSRDKFNAAQALAEEKANRNPFMEGIRHIEGIPDQYLGDDPVGMRQQLIQSVFQADQEQRSFADMVKGESDLRKEINTLPEVKNGVEALTSFKRITAAAAGDSGPDDIAIVFNFMKMLDPESVVRESEYATAANAAGVPERVRAAWNRLKDGDKLDAKTRETFLSAAARQANVYSEGLRSVRERYAPIAESYGYNQDRVLPKTAYSQVYDYDPQTGSFRGLE